MALAPFEQQRFRDLPEAPRVPHPYFAVTSREVTIDSAPFGRIGVHLREHGSGPPLLLVHGLMTTSYSFRYVLEPLGRHFCCIAPDLPGAGRSGKPDRSYRADDLATFLAELVEALGLGRALVLGNSLGGYIAMRFAMKRPDLVERLVNLHSPGVPIARLSLLKLAFRLPFAEPLLARLIDRDPERWAHGNVHYWDETLKSLEEAREYAAPLRTAEGKRAFARYLSQTLDPADMRGFIEALGEREFPVPLLLVYARRDPMVPPPVGEALAAAAKGSKLVWLDEASHFAHVDAPEAFLRAALPFLRGEA